MTGRAVLTAIGPSGVRRYRIHLLRGHRQPNAPAASDRFALAPHATPPAARQRPLPVARCAAGSLILNLPLTSDHSITSSARASTVVGTSRPSVLAVLRLITSSNLVGACTGRSAAFSPLRMRSTYVATCRY